MINLKGIAYRSGHIDFSQEDNEWAFRKIESEMKSGQERRIRFSPDKAPVELRSSGVEESEIPWLEQAQKTLQTADSIYLQLQDGYLRFRQAIHELKKNQRFITLSSQEEVDHFAETYWNSIRYFFAERRDLIKFDLNRMISCKNAEAFTELDIELPARVDSTLGDIPRITFDSSGSKTDMDIVEWRSGIKEGERGKFFPEARSVRIMVAQANQPISILQEYREEFTNYSYSLPDEKLYKKLNLVIKKRMAETASS